MTYLVIGNNIILRGDIMKKCPKCNTFIDNTDIICEICGYNYEGVINQSIYNTNIIHLKNNTNQVCCPKCKSTQIQIMKRGWKLTTGFVGSNSNERVCLNCKHKF